MSIFLVDEQRWMLVTIDEMKNIINSGLTTKEFTKENIKKFLLY